MGALTVLLLAPVCVPSASGAPPASLPPGPPSVVVQSLTGGDEATDSIAVRLALVWPPGAGQATVDNGDGLAQTFAVADALDWQLAPLGATDASAARTVSVRFTGDGIPDAMTSDTIVLDTTAPRVPLQRLYQNGEGWFLALGAEDRGTGLRSIALLGRTGQPLQTLTVCVAGACAPRATEIFFTERARPRVARVTDAAGGSKVVTLVRRATHCSLASSSYPVFTADPGFYDCYRAGDRCRQHDGHFWRQSAYARCRAVGDVHRVVVVAS